MSGCEKNRENQGNYLPDDIVDIDERSDEEIRLEEPELKDRYALGLEINPETGLPRVTALGRGLIAKRMLEKARESGVEVSTDPAMVERMFRPTDDRAIPSRTYEIIAEILTFIYRINETLARESAGHTGEKTPETDGEIPENETGEKERESEDYFEE